MEILRSKVNAKETIKVAAAVFDDYEILDLFGVLEMFACVNPSTGRNSLEVSIVGPRQKKVKTDCAPIMLCDYFYGDQSMPKFDVLLVPGGKGWQPTLKDASFVEWFKKAATEASAVLSVCTGAGILAELGLLEGKKATTNKLAFRTLESAFPNVKWIETARWAQDSTAHGEVWTSSGVSAGTDMAIEFLYNLLERKHAEKIWNYAEHSPIRVPNNDKFSANIDTDKEQFSRVDLGNVETLRVGMLLYENFEMLDCFSPLEMFAMTKKIGKTADGNPAMAVETIAERKIVKAIRGPRFEADLDFSELSSLHQRFDLLVLPGGVGTVKELFNPKFQEALKHLALHVPQVLTVCTGSALLARTGVLDGKKATTNKISFNLMRNFGTNVQWIKNARWVVDGKFVTSSGVAAGGDAALALLEKKFGSKLADAVTLRAEYMRSESPEQDPFAANIPDLNMFRRIEASATSALLKFVVPTLFNLGLDSYLDTSKL